MDVCDIKCIDQKKVNLTLETFPNAEEISRMADIFKALCDPSRLKIVIALMNQEHCVCDIAAICLQTNSAVSHQLRYLRSLNIVKNRREGKIVYYSINDDHVARLVNISLTHIRH